MDIINYVREDLYGTELGMIFATLIFVLLLIIYLVACVVYNLFKRKNEYVISGGRSVKSLEMPDKHHHFINSRDPSDFKKFINSEDYSRLMTEMLKNPNKVAKFFSDIEGGMSYRRANVLGRKSAHIGQLKLFLTELEFLTDYLSTKEEDAYVIYAGSAPSHKLSHLSKMFPSVKWILVDPLEHLVKFPRGKTSVSPEHIDEFVYLKFAKGNRFHVKDRKVNVLNRDSDGISVRLIERSDEKSDEQSVMFDNIAKNNPDELIDFVRDSNYTYYILEDFFSNDLSHVFGKLKDSGSLYFISDIRSRDEDYDFPGDIDIIWNSAMMRQWLLIMRPLASMLKFHTPYFDPSRREDSIAKLEEPFYKKLLQDVMEDGIDYAKDFRDGVFRYMPAEKIYNQAFAASSSSESRLIITNYDDIVDYDNIEYENKYIYFNKIMRFAGFYTEYSDIMDEKHGIDGCHDCALMSRIFVEYFMKFDGADRKSAGILAKKSIIDLMSSIKRKFIIQSSSHGHFYRKIENYHHFTVDQLVNVCFEYPRANNSMINKNYTGDQEIVGDNYAWNMYWKLRKFAENTDKKSMRVIIAAYFIAMYFKQDKNVIKLVFLSPESQDLSAGFIQKVKNVFLGRPDKHRPAVIPLVKKKDHVSIISGAVKMEIGLYDLLKNSHSDAEIVNLMMVSSRSIGGTITSRADSDIGKVVRGLCDDFGGKIYEFCADITDSVLIDTDAEIRSFNRTSAKLPNFAGSIAGGSLVVIALSDMNYVSAAIIKYNITKMTMRDDVKFIIVSDDMYFATMMDYVRVGDSVLHYRGISVEKINE